MKTTYELNNEIIKVTMNIEKTYPELAKYISELPISTSDESDSVFDKEALKEYLDSLNNLIASFTRSNQPLK